MFKAEEQPLLTGDSCRNRSNGRAGRKMGHSKSEPSPTRKASARKMRSLAPQIALVALVLKLQLGNAHVFEALLHFANREAGASQTMALPSWSLGASARARNCVLGYFQFALLLIALESSIAFSQTNTGENFASKPPPVKMFGNQPIAVRVWETENKTKLRIVVSIATGKGKHVEYAQVKVRALDTAGTELLASRRKNEVTHFMDVMGTQTGIFEVSLSDKQAIAAVEVRFAGVVQTFKVDEVLKPVQGPS